MKSVPFAARNSLGWSSGEALGRKMTVMQSAQRPIMEAGRGKVGFLHFPSKCEPECNAIFLTNSRNPFHNICLPENTNFLYILRGKEIPKPIFMQNSTAEIAFFNKSGESYQNSPVKKDTLAMSLFLPVVQRAKLNPKVLLKWMESEV